MRRPQLKQALARGRSGKSLDRLEFIPISTCHARSAPGYDVPTQTGQAPAVFLVILSLWAYSETPVGKAVTTHGWTLAMGGHRLWEYNKSHHLGHRHHQEGELRRDRPQDAEPKTADSYLHRWLDETVATLPTLVDAPSRQKSVADSTPPRGASPWNPHNLADVSVNVDLRRRAGNTARGDKTRKRPPPTPHSPSVHRQEDCHSPSLSPSRPRGNLSRHSKGDKEYLSESLFNNEYPRRKPPLPAFEKRRRHKTKEDRYEPKGREKSKGGANLRKDKNKSDSRRKGPKKLVCSKDVVTNFKSDAIHQDRITLPSCLQPGLFRNGKKSGRSHLPDFTFHDMSFFAADTREPRKPSLSSINRAKRKKTAEEREMKEISEYFRSGTAAKAHDRRPVEDDRRSPSELSSKIPSRLCDRKSSRATIEQNERQPSGLDGNVSAMRYSDESRQHQGADLSSQLRRPASKSTTYFTWSPEIKNITHAPQSTASPTKDNRRSPSSSVARKALEKTGLLSGTRLEQDGVDARQLDVHGNSGNSPTRASSCQERPKNIYQYQDRGVMTTQDMDTAPAELSKPPPNANTRRASQEQRACMKNPFGAHEYSTDSIFAGPVLPVVNCHADRTPYHEVRQAYPEHLAQEPVLTTEDGDVRVPSTRGQRLVPAAPRDVASHISGFGFVLPRSEETNVHMPTHTATQATNNFQNGLHRNFTPILPPSRQGFLVGDYRSSTADSATLGRSGSTRPTSTAVRMLGSRLSNTNPGAISNPGYGRLSPNVCPGLGRQKEVDSMGGAEGVRLSRNDQGVASEPVENISQYIQRIERQILERQGIPEAEVDKSRQDQNNALLHIGPMEPTAKRDSVTYPCYSQDDRWTTGGTFGPTMESRCVFLAGDERGTRPGDMGEGGIEQPPRDPDMAEFWRPNRFAWY
ncbi:hypothetical protein MKZ38_000379 [Zalerion maritima]|uniref:Uncharacterized protein n=1 Tax=Zalerion maritima TaxID=339359 RepID=A0AAD5WSJ7_9PEZI|nr:hypothetical protein MKZ38_000379 [Zalerion maritima]